MRKTILKSRLYGLSLSYRIQNMGQIAWQFSQEVNSIRESDLKLQSGRAVLFCGHVIGLLDLNYKIWKITG